MSQRAHHEILPKDFLLFLSRNYKTINDVEKKVEQFQNDPWSNFYKKFGCRNWRNLRLCSTKCDSVDSCFSDKDIKKVIRARLKPRMKRVESNERIEGEIALENLKEKAQGAPVDFSYLPINFPLVSFAPDLYCSSNEQPTALSIIPSASFAKSGKRMSHFVVKGNRLPIFDRANKPMADSKERLRSFETRDRDGEVESSSQDSLSDADSILFHIFGDELRPQQKVKSSNEVGDRSSRQLLTLTLPPLHQSVLTLLGQKTGAKSSPRNIITEHGAVVGFDSGSANKAKKLRRHGRKKKAKDEGKESEEKELEKPEASSQGAREGRNEELQETQLNTFLHGQTDQSFENEDEQSEEPLAQSDSYLKQIKSLRDVLDGHLKKEYWSQKEMETLNEDIVRLSESLKKYQTDFKTKSISMNEEEWLAFPRTCTRNSATFGVPWNSKYLRDLEPVTYLRDYVIITEPRFHLYNLIYQRYRILENPTGKSITVKRALTEVLGRQFSDTQMTELKESYLNIDNDYELDSKAFAGICAFCERIYGKYELENCSECAVCSMSKVTDKERCHVKRKNELEEIDLSYLVSKIKLGEASANLKRIIMGLTKADIHEKLNTQ